MELVFQEQKQEYLCRILCDMVSQEQTADVVIPDSIPDADRVVDAFGTLLVRSEECSADSAQVTGSVPVGAICVDEGGTPYCVKTEIPFSVRRDFPQQENDCYMQCRCILKSVDARLLNSRKVLIRVGIACTVQVFSPRIQTQYYISEPAKTLQLQRREIPMRLPMGVGDRSFSVNEELDLPEGKNSITRLLKCLYRPKITEQRMVGSKAVFKGELLVHALYEDTEQKLCTWQWNVPFSQYAEMERELDEGDLQTFLTLTSVETEPDSQFESRRLLLSAGLLAQCLTMGIRNVNTISDAYCTDAELTPQWEEWEMDGLLDRQTYRETATYEGEQEADGIVDAWLYRDEIEKKRNGMQMELAIPMSCNVLYYDSEGNLQGKTLHPTAKLSTELAESAVCEVSEVTEGDLYCSASRQQLTLRVPLDITVDCTAKQQFKAVCGGKIEPFEEKNDHKPAVILRRTDAADSVWEIAKQFHTPVQEILSANQLEEETVPEGTLLLIPV